MTAPTSSYQKLPRVWRWIALAAVAVLSLVASAPSQAADWYFPTETIGSANQFSYAAGVAVRTDGQVLVADSDYSAGHKVLRFDTANALQNTASISATSAGSGINCVAQTGGPGFITNSPWDRPIRKYDDGGAEIGWVDGQSMFLGSQFNGKPGPGNVECVARSLNYVFAISDRGSDSTIPSLSRWNLSDLSLGPDREGTPFSGYLTGLTTDFSTNVYVVDSGAHQLQSFDSDLQLRWTTSGPGTGAGLLDNPSNVAVDSPSGLAYVVDNGTEGNLADNRLVAFSTTDGSFVRTIRIPFNASAITFDQTNDWEPILGSGPSVYRGQFKVQPILRMTTKPRKVSRSKTASFRFASDEAGTVFTCQLDRKKAKTCLASTRFRGLKRGRHILKVSGKAPVGIASKTTAYTWTVR